ncbi:MAG TPA: hypothetical protein VEL31_26930, partial [Ktedonobacteraceae bacterium]|nr:hypothetical protein [Ktedonobacteraceae bacterium]
DEILSPVYIGWVQGYLDEQREPFEQFLKENSKRPILIRHPRDAYREFVTDLARPENTSWLA